MMKNLDGIVLWRNRVTLEARWRCLAWKVHFDVCACIIAHNIQFFDEQKAFLSDISN